MQEIRKKKAIVFSLGLAAAMLSATSLQAQGILGDLLETYYEESDQQPNNESGMLNRITGNAGISTENFGASPLGGITIEEFETPLSSGIFMLLAAGAGYATLKSKKRNEINKSKEEI